MGQRVLGRDARAATRLDVRLVAGLREPGSAQKFEVSVRDLSIVGMRIETSFTLKPGARVFVTFPGLAPLEATIAWARHYLYGARFDRPLHSAVVDHIAARYRRLD